VISVSEEVTPAEVNLLRVQEVEVHFPVKTPLIQQLLSHEKQVVHAVDGVSFDLRRGEILGLVGESGCGKTTLGRTILRLLEPTSGRIIFEGRDISHLSQSKLRPLRRRMQIIFQDPHASLNPAMTIGRAIGHPLQIHGIVRDAEELRQRVLDIMREVGLTPEDQLYDKYPGDLSGGQKQRAVIARAMILDPKLLVVDEGVAMLDMSVRAKVLELMLSLKQRYGLTYIFITHDLATAKFLCDRIAIMYLGRIVELGPAASIYAEPKHPYTQALLQVIPIPDPDKRRKKILPRGEVPDAIHPPAGCRFHPRCQSVLPTCGWEGRDFIELLDEYLSSISGAGNEKEVLGSIEEWWAKGFGAGRKIDEKDPKKLVEKVKGVLTKALPAMARAVQSVELQGDSVIVQFRTPDQLVRTNVANDTVECLLYQQSNSTVPP
jgi:oligopeptide/dipeptide ABC transporter ATP-binding protein